MNYFALPPLTVLFCTHISIASTARASGKRKTGVQDMEKAITLTQEQLESLEGVLKSRIFDHEFHAERRNTPKMRKQMHRDEAAKLQAILNQIVAE